MNDMNELSAITLRNKFSFVENQELSTQSFRPFVFTDYEPRMEFNLANADRARLQLAAQQNERKRIAQELHDTLLQGFTSVALKLDALSNSLPAGLSKTKQQLQRILEQTDEYLADARRSIWKLRSTTLESAEDLPGALVKASERALEGTAIRLSFSVQGTQRRIQNALEENLLRICQESVANAVKHACPTQVEVSLEFYPEAVQLQVRDDGCGFDPAGAEAAKRGHFGLVGMKERVEALSGMLLIDSAPRRGTCVRMIVPTSGRPRDNARASLGVPENLTGCGRRLGISKSL